MDFLPSSNGLFCRFCVFACGPRQIDFSLRQLVHVEISLKDALLEVIRTLLHLGRRQRGGGRRGFHDSNALGTVMVGAHRGGAADRRRAADRCGAFDTGAQVVRPIEAWVRSGGR